MGLVEGAILLLSLGLVSSRSVGDITKKNSSSIDGLREAIFGLEGNLSKGTGFKQEIEELIKQFHDVPETLKKGKDLNEFIHSIPPSWMLLLPNEFIINSWIKNPQMVLAKYLVSLPSTDPTATKIVSSFSNQDNDTQRTLLVEISKNKDISKSIWTTTSEIVSREWWSDKNATDIVKDLADMSKEGVKFLPFDVVRLAKDIDGLDIFSDDDKWNNVPRAHICIWKNVIEKSTLILRRIYDAMKPTSKNNNMSGGFISLLQCFSPRDLSNWIAESNRVFNGKTPILEMIKNAQKLGLNQLQVQTLNDGIEWSDQSIDARKNVFHMLDASLIGPQDIKDYNEDYFRRYKISWDLVVRVHKLKLEHTSNQMISNRLLRDMGPIYVSRLRDESNADIESLSLEAVNGAFSPWMRLTQARNILKHMDDQLAIVSDLAFALPSTNILEWTDAKINRVYNAEKMVPTQKWAMAENILSNNHFAPYYPEIIEWIHPRSNLSFLKNVEDLPHSLAFQISDYDWKLLASPLNKKDIKTKLPSLIPGLTCSKVEKSSLLDLPIIASAYTNYAKSRNHDNLNSFSTSLRLCFKNQMMKYLKEKASLLGLPDLWSAFTADEAKSFGGYILSSLKLEEIKKIENVSVKKAVIQELGSLSMPELMPSVSYSDMKRLASLGVENEEPSFSAINKVGSLSFLLDESFLMSLHPFDIRAFIKSTLSGNANKKLTCLKKEERETWAGVLSHGFAASRSWTAWNLIHFGDLLINMNAENLTYLNPNNFRRAIAQILEQSQLHNTFSSFRTFDKPIGFVKACESWIEEENPESFKTAFKNLMRFYMRISEYAIRVAKRDSISQLPPKNLRARRALKEKLFEIYNEMKHIWTGINSTNDENYEYMMNLVIQINSEKEQLIKGIIQREEKDMANTTELYKELRSSDTKISEHLDSIEDFMIDTQRLIIRKFKYLYNLTADKIIPDYDEETFCSIVECVDEDWCSLMNCFKINYEDNPIKVTCDGLIAAGKAGMSVNPGDMSHWHKEDVLDCLGVLGTIPWESKEKKTSIWNVIKEYVDLKNTEHLLSLGTLSEVIQLDDVEFKDINIDALSKIGSYPRDSVDLITVGRIQKYLQDAGNSKEILELRKVGMGYLLCSLNEDGNNGELIEMLFGPYHGVDQSPVPNEDNEQRVFDFNRLMILQNMYVCDNENFRKEVAKQILNYYGGSLDGMHPADVSSIGLFVSGFEPDILKKLLADNFEFIHPSGVKYLTSEQVNSISVEKLSRMTPETLAQFKDSHVPKTFPINSKQINLLRHNEPHFPVESKVLSEASASDIKSGSPMLSSHSNLLSSSLIVFICVKF